MSGPEVETVPLVDHEHRVDELRERIANLEAEIAAVSILLGVLPESTLLREAYMVRRERESRCEAEEKDFVERFG